MSCASVPQFKEVFLTPRYLGIAMEYAGGGDMFEFFVRNKVCHVQQTRQTDGPVRGPAGYEASQFLVSLSFFHNLDVLQAFSNSRGLAEDLARWFFQQLIVALDFCHRKGIANRDIKLEARALSRAGIGAEGNQMCVPQPWGESAKEVPGYACGSYRQARASASVPGSTVRLPHPVTLMRSPTKQVRRKPSLRWVMYRDAARLIRPSARHDPAFPSAERAAGRHP